MRNIHARCSSILVMGTLLVVFGCAGQSSEVMNSWVGKTSDELVVSWGAPDQVLEAQDGGTIYVYRKTVGFGQNAGSITLTSVKVKQRIFWIDKRGVITRWSTK